MTSEIRDAFLAGLARGESGDIANYASWDDAADEYVRLESHGDPIIEASIALRLAELAIPAGGSIAELTETAPISQARTQAALTRWRGAVDAAIAAGIAPRDSPDTPGLWLVVVTDKDAAREPDIGFAITVGSRDDAELAGVAMETALAAAGVLAAFIGFARSSWAGATVRAR